MVQLSQKMVALQLTVTGKNAKYIVDNKIGIGAIITIVRSAMLFDSKCAEPAEPLVNLINGIPHM